MFVYVLVKDNLNFYSSYLMEIYFENKKFIFLFFVKTIFTVYVDAFENFWKSKRIDFWSISRFL